MDKKLIELGSAADNLARYIAEHGNNANLNIIRAQAELIIYRAEMVTGVALLGK